MTLPVPTLYGAPARNIHGGYAYNLLAATESQYITQLHYPGNARSEGDRYNTAGPTLDKIPRHPSSLDLTRTASIPGSSGKSRHPWQDVERYLYDLIQDWPIETLIQAKNSTRPLAMVNDAALTIWMLQMFKRFVRGREEDGKSLETLVDCHIVTPIQVAMVDGSIKDGTFDGGIMALKEFWDVVGQKRRPTTLLALGRHWVDQSRWVVHKLVFTRLAKNLTNQIL